VKDPFHRFKFKIQDKMHNLENLLEEKEKIENSNKDILSKQKLIKNIKSLINQIDEDMMILEKELYFQKKKKSPDAKTKEDIMKLLKNKFALLKNRLKPKEEKDNYYDKAQSLDEFYKKIEDKKNTDYNDRDIYEEEEEQIKQWDNRKKKGDEMIKEISGLVKGMNLDAKNLGNTIDEMMKKTDKTKNRMFDVYDNAQKQNDRINKLNKKVK
jgi:chromosome segregation ATPase